MRRLFTAVFYGFTNSFIKRNLTDLSSPSFLMAAAKCVRHFTLMTAHKPLQVLTAEQRPLLNLLEKHIRSVGVSQCIDLKKKTVSALYVLHRLLDHGVATELLIHLQSPIVLAWLLHGRGSQHMNPELKNLMHSKKRSCNSAAASAIADKASCSLDLTARPSEDQEDQVPACKRSKMDCVCVEEEEPNYTMDPQALCLLFSPCNGPSAGPCPSGQIHHLEIRNCGSDSLAVLNPALPTFFCLRSLTLHSYYCKFLLIQPAHRSSQPGKGRGGGGSKPSTFPMCTGNFLVNTRYFLMLTRHLCFFFVTCPNYVWQSVVSLSQGYRLKMEVW